MNLKIKAGRTEIAEGLITLCELCERIYASSALGLMRDALRLRLDASYRLACPEPERPARYVAQPGGLILAEPIAPPSVQSELDSIAATYDRLLARPLTKDFREMVANAATCHAVAQHFGKNVL
jgi:hypothetical protein